MVRTQIYLPENLLSQLKKLALKNKTTTSELIRNAIDNMLDLKKTKTNQIAKGVTYKKSENPLLMISEAGKKYHADADGITDLSINHDKYLYGDESDFA